MSFQVNGKEVKISDFISHIAAEPQLIADLTQWYDDDSQHPLSGIDYETMSSGFKMAAELLKKNEE